MASFASKRARRALLTTNIASQAGTWEQGPSYAPTPGDFGRERTPSEYGFSPGHADGGYSTPLPQSQSGRPHFLDDVESDNESTYNERPSYIPYVIEWKSDS